MHQQSHGTDLDFLGTRKLSLSKLVSAPRRTRPEASQALISHFIGGLANSLESPSSIGTLLASRVPVR